MISKIMDKYNYIVQNHKKITIIRLSVTITFTCKIPDQVYPLLSAFSSLKARYLYIRRN